MKKINESIISGLIGIGIGMIWFGVEVLFSLHGRNFASATVEVSNLIFWILASFIIGNFFYVASFVFSKDDWSLRKQIIVNFFVCLVAWLIFTFALNDFAFIYRTQQSGAVTVRVRHREGVEVRTVMPFE